MRFRGASRGGAILLFGAVACGGNPNLVSPEGDGSGSGGRAGSSAGRGGAGRPVVELPEGGEDGQGTAGRPPASGCDVTVCSPGQRCEEEAGQGTCVDNTCADLDCNVTEECGPAAEGGFVCVSIACESDVDCPLSRYCDGEKCVDDVCDAETRRCDGSDVLVCASNGGVEAIPYTCGSAGYFESVCTDADPAAVGCACEDDWDCPEYTECDRGSCRGTGVEPTCTLPPAPFEDVLPELEFRWGGSSSTSPSATGKAFPWAAQVGSTPVIVSLDDDNGDGFVNELDFPEILFISYGGDSPHQNGVVRALHGGGPRKGEDYFALCGTRRWFEGEPVITDCDPASGNAESREAALARASGALAAGDLDGDGFVEVVVPLENGSIQILNHRGEIVTTGPAAAYPSGNAWRYPAPAIANLDFAGLPEVIVGNRVFTFALRAGSLVVDAVFSGQHRQGTMRQDNEQNHFGPAVCVADLTADHLGLEVVAGTSAYRLPPAVDCRVPANAASDYCENRLTLLWDGVAENPAPAGSQFYPEGFCAVADVLGADTAAAPGPGNPLDATPEVLVLADGELVIFEGATGALLRRISLGGGDQGGAPNVDDFDGDGFPEIATALSDFYTVVDLQEPVAPSCPAWNALLGEDEVSPGANPARDPGGACTRDADCNEGAVCNEKAGSCVCLHSGWRRDTEDDSSKVTSSSVFDFNGDGAAEVIYNDECYFRLYDGASGALYLALPSLSRTIIENPVVADVDNDGNAEIVFVQNNETIQCHSPDQGGDGRALDSWPDGDRDVQRGSLPNGLEVWGDPSDLWVAARRVWNQHAYHVTNITEGGAVPLHEPESFRPLNGRLYNTYRSQPRNYGVAPDLALLDVQISSPDVVCGELSDEIQISVLVKNAGDLRVGPGVVLEFYGTFESPDFEGALLDPSDEPLSVTLDKTLEPGASTIVSVTYRAGNGGRDDLPVEVLAIVDGAERERECNEDNNQIAASVDAGAELADLRVVIDGATCTPAAAEITVFNDGALPAESVLVRVYAGDPSQGGQVLGEATLAGPIPAGGSESATIEYPAVGRNVTLYAVADPVRAITECNDANNEDSQQLDCGPIAR